MKNNRGHCSWNLGGKEMVEGEILFEKKIVVRVSIYDSIPSPQLQHHTSLIYLQKKSSPASALPRWEGR